MTPEELDREISQALLGKSADPALSWLSAEFRAEPPARLRRRISRAVWLRRWSAAQWAAAVLGSVLFWHGLSSIALGRWIAQNIGEPFAPHSSLEGGLAAMAVGCAALACLIKREYLPVAALSAVPLGFAYGIHGIGEVTVFAWGAVFHLTEGIAAAAFLYFWWRTSRYGRRGSHKDKV